MKFSKKFLTGAAALLMAASLFAEDGREIMNKVYDREKPEFTQAAVQMVLTDKNGSVEKRNVGEYGRDKNGLTTLVFVFFSPASVKDTRFLAEEKADDTTDKYIYMPSLRQVRRINASDGSKSFVGTDFSYDDMTDRNLDDDKHEFIKSENKGSWDCYVVKSTPVDPKNSQYSYRISWVDKETYIPVYIELYDKKGKLEKVNEIKALKKMPGKGGHLFNIPTENIMSNVQSGHSTSLKMVNIKIDNPIPDRTFTQQFLSTGK